MHLNNADKTTGKTHRYFGFVEVVLPKTEKGIRAVSVKSLGVAIENGISIGWRDKEQVLVPLKVQADGTTPDEAICSMVVIIRSTAEAKHAAKMLQPLKGENICLTSFE
ncbi:MAG: hypothetical protein JKY34_04960 [Kordiimonadaceae bacterium]|nr:hypothetical protein [Kordiimonadaceae bacterium]